MELKTYLYPLRRWWWLLLVATLAAAVTSMLVTINQPNVYMATTTLMMGRAIEDPNPSANEFYLSQQLAATYADIARRELVRNATMEALGLDWLPNYRAQAQNNSQLIEISVTDTNPARAQAVANELARQLILQTPTSERAQDQERRFFVEQQLDLLESQIEDTQNDIEELQTELGNMVSARQIQDTQNQISALQAKLNTLQSNYANLLANTQSGAVNTLTVIEPAPLPTRPIGPDVATSVLIAAVVGLALSAGAAYLLEYLDDTVRSPEEIKKLVRHPVVGYIHEFSESGDDQPFVAAHPRHPVTEAFRTIRTSLEFASVDKPIKTLLITSADQGEGKSSVAANLGVVIAQGEKKVIIMDADMRVPSMHEVLDVPLSPGLSEIFRGKTTLSQAIRRWKDGKIGILTAGSPPPNPAELIASQKMRQILHNLMEASDLVVIDGPPFMVTDASLLGSQVDGVLLVVRPGFTTKGAIENMMEQIERSGARVVGVVLNHIPREIAGYYGSQTHYPQYGYHGSSKYFEDDSVDGSTKQRDRSKEEVPGESQPTTVHSAVDQSDSIRRVRIPGRSSRR